VQTLPAAQLLPAHGSLTQVPLSHRWPVGHEHVATHVPVPGSQYWPVAHGTPAQGLGLQVRVVRSQIWPEVQRSSKQSFTEQVPHWQIEPVGQEMSEQLSTHWPPRQVWHCPQTGLQPRTGTQTFSCRSQE
jgi:hypothetical protein